MQNTPITSRLRDAWEDAIANGHVDADEIATITTLIIRTDDGMTLALRAMKGGPDTRHVQAARRDYERVHGSLTELPAGTTGTTNGETPRLGIVAAPLNEHSHQGFYHGHDD